MRKRFCVGSLDKEGRIVCVEGRRREDQTFLLLEDFYRMREFSPAVSDRKASVGLFKGACPTAQSQEGPEGRKQTTPSQEK